MAQAAFAIVQTKKEMTCAVVSASAKEDPIRSRRYEAFNARLAAYFSSQQAPQAQQQGAPPFPHLKLVPPEPIQK